MKISKIVYLIIALMSFKSCSLFAVPPIEDAVEHVLTLEKDKERLRSGIPPHIGNAAYLIGRFQTRGLTLEDAIRAYFENINIDDEIVNIDEEINEYMNEFGPEDLKRYFELKSAES